MTDLSPLRAGRITGSRIACVLRLAPAWMGTPETVMRDMVRQHHGLPTDFQGNYATDYGHEHEPDCIAAYEAQTGYTVHSQQQFFIHPKYDFLGISVDGLVGHDRVMDAKCPLYGKYYTIHDVPYYAPQLRLTMECTGRRYADLAVWRPHHTEISTIEHSDAWLDFVLPTLQAFHEEYLRIIADPALSAPYLAPLVDYRADPEWSDAATRYLELDQQIKALQAEQAEAADLLKKLADGKTTKGAGVHVIVGDRKGNVDTKRLAAELGVTDLDKYRAPSSTVTQIRALKESA